jgi:glycosyltransferase involved in cell wall biosynthesis
VSRAGIHGNGRLSMVIPTYSATEELTEMALACAKSFREQVDELIITEDSNIYNEELHRIADQYILHPNLGYSGNTNRGWRLSTGDFTLIVNSDTSLNRGSLGDLCIAGTITSPIMLESSSHSNANVSGAFFCVPRNLWYPDRIFDEHTTKFEGADTVLFNRWFNEIRDLKLEVIKTVVVDHISGTPGPSRRAYGAHLK